MQRRLPRRIGWPIQQLQSGHHVRNGGLASSKSLNSGPGVGNVLALQSHGKILVTDAGLIGKPASF